jgi:hypothetical protein
MTSTNASLLYQEPERDEIELNAFLAWEKEGRQHGREMHYWLQAEAQLREARRKKADAAAALAAQPWPRTASTSARKTQAAPAPKLGAAKPRVTSPKTKRSAQAA